MSLDEIHLLWKLHQVDYAIVEIRSKAAAFDPGRQLMAEIKQLQDLQTQKEHVSHELSGELADLELKQKGFDEKIKKIDHELYGGKINSPREIENYEKDLEMLKRLRAEADERIIELWELVPPAKKVVTSIEERIKEKQTELREFQKEASVLKSQLENDFKALSAKRPGVAKAVPEQLLTKYEAIRKKHDGIAMARITKEITCEMCGMKLAERLIQSAKDGRVAICEGCGRILYHSESII